MRVFLVVSFCTVLVSVSALAQTAPAPTAAPAPTRGGDITRDQYIEQAVERARRAAEKRFDKMDTDHDGVLTADERRAVRAQRKAAPPQ
jgi:hypothetical protein